MERRTISSGTKWEPKVGYSRAIRRGPFVYVSGTTATDEDGELLGEDDPYAQAVAAMSKVVDALEQAGAAVEDVVRTRMYVADADDWEAAGRAHAETFGEVRPASSMVEVSRLIDTDLLVEVEADAVIGEAFDALGA